MTSTMDLVHSYVSEYPNDTCGAKERAALEQRIKELEADAKRYRWLRPALTRGGNVEDSGDLVAAFSHLKHTPTETEFDDAIDRAMSEAALTKAVEISQEDKLP